MIDQMVQAARSGRQNIAEGSRAAATTSQTELRLIHVARANLEELLLDYEDYLRQWDPEGPEAMEVRNVPRAFQKRDPTDLTDRPNPSDPTPPKPPACPSCDSLMALRTAKTGKTPAANSGAAPLTPRARAQQMSSKPPSAPARHAQ